MVLEDRVKLPELPGLEMYQTLRNLVLEQDQQQPGTTQDMSSRIIDKLTEMHRLKYGNDEGLGVTDCLDVNRFDNLSSIMISPNEISNVLYATNGYV